MAREGYRTSPPPEQPFAYDQQDPRYPPPPPYRLSTGREDDRSRPRGMSSTHSESSPPDSATYNQARQPIDEAVNSAFRGTDTTSAIPPEILTQITSQITSQITASVIEQLKASNLPAPVNIPLPPHQPPEIATSIPAQSPPMEHRHVYTPPTPHRSSEEHAPAPTSPPPTSPQFRPFPSTHGRFSPTNDQPQGSPTSLESQTEHDKFDRQARPKGPKRLSTGQDPTILEKIWGTLFTDDGEPTPRLGQFLRGIAVHLIEDYEPVHSLVITPSKMQKYYEDTKLAGEAYPWQVVFDDRTSSISRLYREIEAQHHLVQDKLDERPDIPGLTPHGFERWAMLLLRAHPDLEFERLQKTALDMPISNPDDKRERFPKEISRRLFPKFPDIAVRDKLEKGMKTHCNVDIPQRSSNNTEPPPPNASSTLRPDPAGPSLPPQPGLSQPQRDSNILSPVASRQTYAAPSIENAIDEEDQEDIRIPAPIERERKPYVAQPGGGRNYEDVNRPPSPPDIRGPTTHIRPGRSGSTTSQGRPNDLPKSRPIPISIHQRPPGASVDATPTPDSANPSYNRANSTIYHQPQSRGTRNRSPSAAGTNGRAYGHASESDVAYGSLHSAASTEGAEDFRRYRDFDRDREKYAGDRYDPGRMKAFDPRDHAREGRTRFQSNVGLDNSRAYYANDDELYRTPTTAFQPGSEGYQPYPPTSYR